MLTPSQVIVIATPVFFLLIAIEWLVSMRRQKYKYRLADAFSSMSLGLLSQTSAIFVKLLTLGIYTAVFEHVSLVRNDAFWTTLPGWLIALVIYDFLYYWNHRLGHEVGVLWAAHVVHHQSQQFNLTTALRQTSSGPLLSWIFYMPMALIGVPPLVFVVVALIDLLYQYWVHTEQIRKLGWFDRWFCSPSNHRVHHAVNDQYIDKNYGGILIIWDRIFGTFKEEDDRDPCVYGTRGLLKSWDPLWANASIYSHLAQDSWHARYWGDKLRVWLKPPGWRPADVAARFPAPAFVLDEHRVLFDPPLSPAVQWFAWLQFFALLALAALFLWNADQAPLANNLIWFASISIAQWILGAVLQGRISVWLALMLNAGIAATATGALGLMPWHMIFKPAAMLLACAQVLASSRNAPVDRAGKTHPVSRRWLLVALQWSFVGDVCLMFSSPAMFVPGLVSFLLAHLAYVVVLKRGMPWFADRRALLATLLLGMGMYAILWKGGLPVELRIPVAIYVTVIALMAAQAWGRWRIMQSLNALQVALGASFFMLSDSILAIDRFVRPVPYAIFWVLLSYFAAQGLIVWGLTGKTRASTSAAQAAPAVAQ